MTIQYSLFGQVGYQNRNIILKMKKYIQPFERILALKELQGLTNLKNIENNSKNEIMCIETDVSYKYLEKRLAYWEKIGVVNLKPTFQVLLEGGLSYDNFSDSDLNDLIPKRRILRYGLHDLHEYRGKFFPQLVKALINIAGVEENGIVLDPTCGSGTTNLVARAMGMKTIGLDLNPLSVKIAKTKTGMLDVDLDQLIEYAENIATDLRCEGKLVNCENSWNEMDNLYLSNWFDSLALEEINKILCCIKKVGNDTIKEFFELCLSNIVRTISWQKESDLRVRKEIFKYVDGMVIDCFENEVNRQLEQISPYIKLIQKTNKLVDFEICEGDTKKIDEIYQSYLGKCDVLITSPPYATALPYIDTDRLSLILLGLLPKKELRKREYLMIGNREVTEKQRLFLWETYQNRKFELPNSIVDFIDNLAKYNHSDTVGFRRRNLPALLSKYFLDMSDAMKNALNMMKPGSYAFYVVGNNSTKVDSELWTIPTNQFLWEIGDKVGWLQEEIIDMELLPSRDIFKNNSGTSETILIFRKKKGEANAT